MATCGNGFGSTQTCPHRPSRRSFNQPRPCLEQHETQSFCRSLALRDTACKLGEPEIAGNAGECMPTCPELVRARHAPRRARFLAWKSYRVGCKPPRTRSCIPRFAFRCLQGAYIRGCLQFCKRKTARMAAFNILIFIENFGAGEGIRTLDPNLGKVVLYP